MAGTFALGAGWPVYLIAMVALVAAIPVIVTYARARGKTRQIDRAVLTSTIAYYQKLGCWTPHVEITRPAFEVALDVFQHAGLITKRHRYEDVVAAPPAA